LANIVLTLEKPQYKDGTWHVEGMNNRRSCQHSYTIMIARTSLSLHCPSAPRRDNRDIMQNTTTTAWSTSMASASESIPTMSLRNQLMSCQRRALRASSRKCGDERTPLPRLPEHLPTPRLAVPPQGQDQAGPPQDSRVLPRRPQRQGAFRVRRRPAAGGVDPIRFVEHAAVAEAAPRSCMNWFWRSWVR